MKFIGFVEEFELPSYPTVDNCTATSLASRPPTRRRAAGVCALNLLCAPQTVDLCPIGWFSCYLLHRLLELRVGGIHTALAAHINRPDTLRVLEQKRSLKPLEWVYLQLVVLSLIEKRIECISEDKTLPVEGKKRLYCHLIYQRSLLAKE